MATDAVNFVYVDWNEEQWTGGACETCITPPAACFCKYLLLPGCAGCPTASHFQPLFTPTPPFVRLSLLPLADNGLVVPGFWTKYGQAFYPPQGRIHWCACCAALRCAALPGALLHGTHLMPVPATIVPAAPLLPTCARGPTASPSAA